MKVEDIFNFRGHSMIANIKEECIDRQELRTIQYERLLKTINRVYNNVPFYKNKMDEMGITPESIKDIEDLSKLPFTTKDDLRENYPYNLFSVPMSEIVRIHSSSGTTGKPVIVGYTKSDLELWESVVERALVAYGVDKNDFVHVAYGYGLFTGGLGINNAVERLGGTVIPVSGGNTGKQIQIIEDFGSTVLACTPSYALYLADTIEKLDIDKSKLKLRIGIFGAEPWTEEMRGEIEKRLNIRALDIYGLSEIIGPGVSFECEKLNGLHISEDHFLPEIIDPETLEVLPEGSIGELVITTITKEGIPLIRYRTRDLTRLNYEKCECGRTLVRMEKCLGRSDDMLIIRGVNVFPTQVESVILETEGVAPHYLLIVDRKDNLDTLEILVEIKSGFKPHNDEIENMQKRLKSKIESVLGISVDLKLVAPYTLERSMGKAKRVIDNRKNKN